MLESIRLLLRKRTRQEEADLSQAAEFWLKDEALDTVLAMMRDETIQAWQRSRDPETRERAWVMLHAINKVAEGLQVLSDREKVAQIMEERAHRREQVDPV